jgi:hypothetical protein
MFHMRSCCPTLMFFLLVAMPISFAHNQKTNLELPQQLKDYVVHNMQQQLAAFDEIVDSLDKDKLHHASEIADNYLGISSDDNLNKYLPFGMKKFNEEQLLAVKRFSHAAKLGDKDEALTSFQEISSSCVMCHSNYTL